MTTPQDQLDNVSRPRWRSGIDNLQGKLRRVAARLGDDDVSDTADDVTFADVVRRAAYLLRAHARKESSRRKGSGHTKEEREAWDRYVAGRLGAEYSVDAAATDADKALTERRERFPSRGSR